MSAIDQETHAKACKTCKFIKDFSDYPVITCNGKKYIGSHCKRCWSNICQDRNIMREDKIKEWYVKNQDTIAEKRKIYKDNNRDSIRAKERERYHNNIEYEHERSKKKCKSNTEKRRKEAELYYEQNKEAIEQEKIDKKKAAKEKIREDKRNKRKTDPIFRLREGVSNTVNTRLRNQGLSKAGKSFFS